MNPLRPEAIFDFLMTRWGRPHGWAEKPTLHWLYWYLNQPAAVITLMDGGRITALSMARPVTTVVHAEDHYHCDPHADVVWTDVAITTRPGQLPTLFRATVAANVWGQWLAYERRGKLRFWPFRQSEIHMLKPKGYCHG